MARRSFVTTAFVARVDRPRGREHCTTCRHDTTLTIEWYGPSMTVTVNAEAMVRDVIVIGASAGGITAVADLLSRLPDELKAIIGVVIHRGNRSQTDWSDMFRRLTKLQVVEPAHGDSLLPGFVYLAPSDHHMTFDVGTVGLDRDEKQHFTRPAVDPLFTSAARAYGPRVVGVVLTGCGGDGARGLQSITAIGGVTLVQEPSEAEHPSMPRQAIAKDHPNAVLAIDKIGEVLICAVQGRTWSA
jgi:two-component system chemotaxis response regulator CheB